MVTSESSNRICRSRCNDSTIHDSTARGAANPRCGAPGAVKSSGLVKKSSACIATVRLVTSLVSALMKMTGIFFVDGWRRRISQTDRPSRSGSRMSSRIKSGLELPRLAQRLDAVVGHDEVVALPRELVLQQLDEIVLVIHDQNTVRHAAKLAGSAPTTKTARLKRGDEMETGNQSSSVNYSLLKPASRINARKVPFASSRWLGTVNRR